MKYFIQLKKLYLNWNKKISYTTYLENELWEAVPKTLLAKRLRPKHSDTIGESFEQLIDWNF